MSITYSQDTTALQVASTFSLDLIVPRVAQIAVGNKKPLAIINNESGCSFNLSLSGGRNFTIPAGAWTKPFIIHPQDIKLNAIVQNVLPSSPVNLFTITVYNPGEEVIEPVALGNSPIGISGGVTTTSGSSIKNDSNNPPISIIESTPSDQTASSFSLNNDASGFIQVLSANVLRKILNIVRGNSGATKAQITIGDSGDAAITTLYGSIQGAQPAALGATTTTTLGATAITGTTVNATGTIDSSGNAPFVSNPTGVGNNDIPVLDFSPTGATTNKEWRLVYRGATGTFDIVDVTDNNVNIRFNPDGSVTFGKALKTSVSATGVLNATSPANGSGSPDTVRIINGAGTQSLNIGVSQAGDTVNSPGSYLFDSLTTTFLAQGGKLLAGALVGDSTGNFVLNSADGKLFNTVPTLGNLPIFRGKGSGAGAGNAIWEGGIDPGTNAVDGDLWAPN